MMMVTFSIFPETKMERASNKKKRKGQLGNKKAAREKNKH